MKKLTIAALAAFVQAGVLCSYAADAPDNNQSVDNQTAEDATVITVTKHAEAATQLGSDFSKIGSDEIERTQIVDLKESLNTVPGVFASESGGRGGFTTVSLRGNRDDHTLFLLDGIRLNTGIFQNAAPFLDFAGTDNLGSIEIVRGPQSTLYGSEGIGGVISMETKRGEGRPSTSIFSEFGSFGSLREGIRSSGAFGKLGYSFSYERDDTTNDRPNNDLWLNRYSLRLDYQVTDDLTMTLNVHGHVGHYEEPGSIRPQDYASNDPNSYTQVESNLFSLIINWKTAEAWTQKLTLGGYFEHYEFIQPPNAEMDAATAAASTYTSRASNYTADWQNDVQIARNNHLTAGVEFNYLTGHDNTFANHEVFNWAAYAMDEWEPVKNLFLTGGVRYDSYEIGGDAVTYRFTEAYLVQQTDTKFRASYGTAFKAPNFFQTFSTSPYALGDPNLKPERSEGWDGGVDQYLFDRRVVVGATYFQNNIRDLIAFEQTSALTGDYINRDKAQNHGVELSAVATLFGSWKSRVAYTWTESTVTTLANPVSTERLDYQPRHVLSLDTSNRFFGKLLVGGGISYVVGRVGTDYSLFPASQVRLGDYFLVRIYSRYDINDHLSIFARGENLTDAHYQTTLGYPALPLGVFGGVELKF